MPSGRAVDPTFDPEIEVVFQTMAIRQLVHDVTSLLGIVIGHAHLAAAEVTAGDGSDDRNLESVANDLARIQKSATEAAALVHRLLATEADEPGDADG